MRKYFRFPEHQRRNLSLWGIFYHMSTFNGRNDLFACHLIRVRKTGLRQHRWPNLIGKATFTSGIVISPGLSFMFSVLKQKFSTASPASGACARRKVGCWWLSARCLSVSLIMTSRHREGRWKLLNRLFKRCRPRLLSVLLYWIYTLTDKSTEECLVPCK